MSDRQIAGQKKITLKVLLIFCNILQVYVSVFYYLSRGKAQALQFSCFFIIFPCETVGHNSSTNNYAELFIPACFSSLKLDESFPKISS